MRLVKSMYKDVTRERVGDGYSEEFGVGVGVNHPQLASLHHYIRGSINRLYSFAPDFQWCCLTDQGSPSVMQHIVSVESSSLLFHSYLT